MKKIFLALALGLFAIGYSSAAVYAADLAHKDKSFITKAAKDGMMEVQLGQIAKEKGQSQEVKDFGARMMTDHAKANEELKALAQQKGVQLPTEMEHKAKSANDKLNKKMGMDFDKAYMKMMVKDHTADVKAFQKASEGAKDPDVKAFAAKTLPTLQEHLQQAKDIASKVGAK